MRESRINLLDILVGLALDFFLAVFEVILSNLAVFLKFFDGIIAVPALAANGDGRSGGRTRSRS